MKIKVGVSNHHIHVTKEVLEILFGIGYELTPKRYLLQKGQFACEETVNLEHNGKILEHVRIIGPCRKYTQVELLDIDNEFFGFKAPLRSSGDLSKSETINIIGPKGTYKAIESTIVSNTHIHFDNQDLINSNKDLKELVKVKMNNGKIIENVHLKSDETCVLEMHINKDIAKKINIETGDEVTLC